jgi:hypothetical protein
VLPSPPRGALHPSADGHHLVDADGKPFFWLADSIYAGLYSYASLADVAEYLDVRRRQGFTVIKTLVPNDSTDSADPDGHRIVQDGDWSRPNPAFFARVDAVLDMARDRGMIIVLLFRADTPALAEWMARRYRDRTNVLWWVWDDYQPTIAAVAKGVTGRDVKTDAADPAWPALGFGIYAPAGDERNAWRAPWTAMAEAWALQPAKPSVRGDGCYEAHPYARGPFPQSPYWHFLSGTAFTYGYDRPVWEFADGWRTMLDSDGARQTALFARFFTARPWWTLEPDQTLLDRPAEGTVAARTHDRSAAYVFVADRATVRLRAGAVDGAHKAFWFDPRTGDTRDVAAIGAAAVELTPPWPEALLAVE